MRVECRHCRRAFDVGGERVGVAPTQISNFRCVCNERIDLADDVNDASKPRLGKYVLVNKIATGGMGEIYYGKVSGVEGFEKEVAIKRMLPHLASDRDFVTMMVKEAKLTVLLNHPNIVGIYDLAREADAYYIAMEYVPGITVGTILEQLRRHEDMLPPEVAVHIITCVLRGLSYAHNLVSPNGDRLTILHRDITPQNILVTKRGFVKITDFGIAKALNEITTTSAGMIKGKVGYIAPEQLEGKEPDQRIDLFCAGILLWEMLMAKRLFKGTSEIDTFRLISECKVPAPSTLRGGIDTALDSVVLRSLARNPDARYLQGDDFIAALARAMAPRTLDEIAHAAGRYLSEHPDFFTSIASHKGAPSSDGKSAVPTEKLPPITDFLIVPTAPSGAPAPAPSPAAAAPPPPPAPRAAPVGAPPPPPGRAWLRPVLAAVTLCLLGGVAVVWRYQLSQATAPLIVTSFSSEPNAPAAPPLMAPAAPASPPAAPKVPPEQPAAPAADSPAAPRPARRPPHREVVLRPLRAEEIQATFQRHQADIARCLASLDLATAPNQVEAQVTIEPSGSVSNAALEPALDDPAGRCLMRALRRLRFRRHPTPGFKVTVPLKIKQN